MSLSKLIDLSGKTALISGASKGIGAATAHVLAACGADLVLFSRHMPIEATQAAFSAAYGRTPLVFQADVSDAQAMAEIVQRAAAQFGSVDILVNNAAINVTAPLLEMTDEQWWTTLNANLIAAARLSALCAPYMQARRWGRIINISSNLGVFALANKGVYSASKAALLQLTRNLALELGAHGILVNALAVGAINTDAQAANGKPARDYDAIARTIILKRLGTAEEVAHVVLFLASELSSYITGQTIFVDGGGSVWFPA
ncbi:MAG: SDR family NAD(P)-dependent oxidoreductase [Anaerolineae bacterium]|nr:SDR family oxidoreductase [Anaerolineae bacterium]MDW8300027.1 SDR family NAD(P)-dependent oxidoreductase [Anaerolineae bacterium]